MEGENFHMGNAYEGVLFFCRAVSAYAWSTGGSVVFNCLFFLWLQAMVREVCIPRLPRGNDGGGDRTYYLNSRLIEIKNHCCPVNFQTNNI